MPTEAPEICPECESEDVHSVPEQSKEFVCPDCGLVIEDSADITEYPEGPDWRASRARSGEESTPVGSKDRGETDVVEEGWSAWDPCHKCGSTSLEQTFHEEYSISVDEDGGIVSQKEKNIFDDQRVECADCGEVLKDF